MKKRLGLIAGYTTGFRSCCSIFNECQKSRDFRSMRSIRRSTCGIYQWEFITAQELDQ
jgi:hypothetical protein